MGAIKGHPYYGGGRAPGQLNATTAEIKHLLHEYTPAACKELARLSTEAESEQARVAAIKEILDRVYGKTPQAIVNGDGTPLVSDDSQQSLAMLARKVALAFRLAEMDKEQVEPLAIEGEATEESESP